MNSIIREGGFAKASQYPVGMMNVCVCGQVVLAPAKYHKDCE